MATRIEELRVAASTAWDVFAHEMAQYNDDNLPTSEQAAHIDTLRTSATAAQRELNDAESFVAMNRDFQAQDATLRAGRNVAQNATAQGAQRLGSLGARFAERPEFAAWLATVAPSGNIPRNTIVHSPAMGFEGLLDLERQPYRGRRGELITGSDVTSGGAFVIPDQYGPLTELGRRPLTIRDVITNLTTNSDSVDYVRQVSETNNAAPVPESNVTDSLESGGEPGIKPESGMTFERKNAPVITIAHWIPATTRALQDAGQLRGLIDAFLRYGVELELEDQIVTGDGTGENFEGILEVDGLQIQPFTEDIFRTTRQARRKVLTVGRRRPNAFLLNPIDWENIELEKDDNGRYYYSGPIGMGPEQLWRLPVIESEAIPQGTGLVGDFSTCVLWDRMQASIAVSNSHADFFIRNMVAILCELRAAFGVLKPNALVAIEMAGS